MSGSVETLPADGAADGAARPEEGAAGSRETRQVHPPPPPPPLPPAQSQNIPDELLVSLTSTVGNRRTQGLTAHHRHCKCCGIRRPDAVWHHPIGRTKYKYFLEQPPSLTGAGRDISFLCDAVQRKTPLPPLADRGGVSDKQNQSVSESLIPEEYHIVRNKGLQSLQFYEDRFTVQLQDDERNLRVFPSLKPSGRLEVVQLMKMMDDMLEKAGVGHESEELTELSQMEGLLKMVQTEQNIYNLVFHELIRQVSVGCAERGQLLAKLRQRYQSLLERIPLRLKALHTEAVAQRAVDRRLTEEIHHVKASIQQLSTELSRIKDHDAFVSQQAELAHKQLAEALNHTHINSDMLEGFHELYALQRGRLEAQLLQISEERDCWSRLAFRLALKVVSVKKLHLVSRLHVCEQSWLKTAEQCSVYITSKDTDDMNAITALTDSWKEQLSAFTSDQRKAEQVQGEQMSAVQQGITRWLTFCAERNKSPDPKYEPASMEEIHADLKQWSDMLARQSECYQGEQLLSCQQKLGELGRVQQRWLDKSRQLFSRHPQPGGEAPGGQQVLTELDRLISEHHKHLDARVSGENGIYKAIASLLGLLGPCVDKLGAAIGRPEGLPVSDWLKLEKALCSWKSLAEEIWQKLSIVQMENLKDQDTHTEAGEVLNKVREFMRRLSTFSECENQRLFEQIGSLHMAQIHWMLDVLLLMVPDHSDNQSQEQELEHLTNISLQKLDDDAKMLAEKLDCFSKHITSSYQLIVEEQILQDPQKVEVENDLDECRKLQTECTGWLETCLILLSGIKEGSMDPSAQQADLAFSCDLPVSPADSTESLANKEDSAEEDTETFAEPKEQGEPTVRENPVVKLIGYDGNITPGQLGESSERLTGTDEWVASPAADESQKAFRDGTRVGLLQQELYESELQTRSAEQRALKAEEALQAALEKIRVLERQLQELSDVGPKNSEGAAEEKKTPIPPSPLPVTDPAASKKSISEAKGTSSTKKTKKR